jgi:hypothetical protein
VVKFDSARDIADAEDQGNGIRLVREQQPEYDGIDAEYEELSFKSRFLEPDSSCEKMKQKFSMMTAAELLRQQKAK